jgi:MoaA/NifB/PqqE/SkfB family radical SAM enzyme
MFSHQCNMTCKHCGILSSPKNKARMPMEDARRYIDEAAAISQFKKVTFTGGEPMMFQDQHAELLARCKGHGLQTRMVTNGFWAKTVDKGMVVLSRMKQAGLTEINFSADEFHLEFGKAETLRNALECARRLDFTRIISFVSNSAVPPLDHLSEMYGLPRDQLEDLQAYKGDYRKIPSLKHEKMFVWAGGLIGLGRAAEYPEMLRHFPVEIFDTGNGCDEVVNKSVIYPDGDLQACCCAGGKIKAFTVGSLHEHSLLELFKKMFSRSHYLFINSYGPKALFDEIVKARPDLPRPKKCTSICEVCVRATEGMAPEEVDRIVDAATIARMLSAIGIKLEEESVNTPS